MANNMPGAEKIIAGFILEDFPQPCRVYWGSHGCHLPRGHEGPHLCECVNDAGIDPDTREYPDGTLNVGAPPYYGPATTFYGEDA